MVATVAFTRSEVAVPRGKDFCLFENEFFDFGEFEIKDGVRLHNGADPCHRQDGVLAEVEKEKVRPASDVRIPPLAHLTEP